MDAISIIVLGTIDTSKVNEQGDRVDDNGVRLRLVEYVKE